RPGGGRRIRLGGVEQRRLPHGPQCLQRVAWGAFLIRWSGERRRLVGSPEIARGRLGRQLRAVQAIHVERLKRHQRRSFGWWEKVAVCLIRSEPSSCSWSSSSSS